MDKSLKSRIAQLTRTAGGDNLEGLHQELATISARLDEIEQEREKLEARAERITDALEVLAEVSHEKVIEELDADTKAWNDLADLGIQEACYRILRMTKTAMDAGEIRQSLLSMGVMKVADGNPDGYANPLAVIHTSLKRIPDRVRSFKRKVSATGEHSPKIWVRYYEAIEPGTEKSPKC